MTTIEIARRFAELGEKQEAVKAYTLVTNEDSEPAELLEAAAYILDNGGDYKISYTTFVQLYNAGYFREDILPLMTRVFYEPNIRLLAGRYERNVKLLEKYPYIFRRDFPSFDDLSISFIPYDDHSGYVPFDLRQGEFMGFVNVKDPVVSRNFFHDLDKPILADDVYSQYELEYLRDNVRRSEDVARENHVYLHYTDWDEFCSWLAVLNMRPLLEDKKLVFLFGDEIELYPIDFKERFGIDYSQFTVKPLGLREVTRLIWHTQLSSHNGGDFFNEIFDAHPNLICMPSLMMSNVEDAVNSLRDVVEHAPSLESLSASLPDFKDPRLLAELFALKTPTDKDLMVFRFLQMKEFMQFLDPDSRICPAVFFQPHFHNVIYTLEVNDKTGNTVLDAPEAENVHKSKIFKGFKYIKTFTPMRRLTTSHAATLRFMYRQVAEWKERDAKLGKDEERTPVPVIPDVIMQRVVNRSFLIDPQDRLYHDSILVRFEDGKLNPEATFTRLAAFLDLPYTQSMTYCSEKGKHDPLTEGNVIGFDTATVYRTYDEWVNDAERYFIEYFLRDAYEFYGYDFQWYDGAEMTEEKADALIEDFTTLDGYMRESYELRFRDVKIDNAPPEAETQIRKSLANQQMQKFNVNRKKSAQVLMRGLRFVNKRGQPLQMTPMLEPDPELLVQPLYH